MGDTFLVIIQGPLLCTPFGDSLEFYFRAFHGKLYDDGVRLDFCRLVGEFAGSNN